MRTNFKIFLIFFIVFFQGYVIANSALISEKEYLKQYQSAQDEIRNYLSKIEFTEKEHENDPEFLVGSAILYSQYANTKRMVEKIDKLWEKVLSFDPNNKIALATTTIKNTQLYTARVQVRLDDLERRIANAQKRGKKSIIIPYQRHITPMLIRKEGETFQTSNGVKSQPELYQYFSTGDNNDIELNNFDAARSELKEKLSTELSDSIDFISNAEKRDPNNALYNYLKAHVYFELGKGEFALDQVRIASKKKYLNTYFVESRKAVSKVLELIDFPEQMRQYITDIYRPIGQFINSNIKVNILEPSVTKYEEQGQTNRVKEIYNMASLIAQQIRTEPMPYETSSQKYGDAIEKWVDTDRNNLSLEISNQEEKIVPKNISPTKKPFGVILPIAGAAGAVIVFAGLFLFLRKRNLNKSE